MVFSSEVNRKRLRETFVRLRQDQKLDQLFDESEKILGSRIRYLLGTPIAWNWRLRGRVYSISMAIMMAWVVPAMILFMGALSALRGEYLVSAIFLPLAAVFWSMMSGAMMEANTQTEEDPEYAFFRAWFLTRYRKLEDLPTSFDSLEVDLIGYVQPQDPTEFARKITTVWKVSRLSFVSFFLLMALTFGVAATGIFQVGSPVPIVIFVLMMALLVIGGADMVYETHRRPILPDPHGRMPPERRYADTNSLMDEDELTSRYSSRTVWWLVRASAWFLLAVGWIIAWEPSAINMMTLALFALYLFAGLSLGFHVAIPNLVYASAIVLGLLGYAVLSSWKRAGMSRSRTRMEFYKRLACAKTPRQIISLEKLLDSYLFEQHEESVAYDDETALVTRIFTGWMSAFTSWPILTAPRTARLASRNRHPGV